MADNVAITAGVGTSVATDDVAVNGGSSAHVQFVKLVDGTANGTSGIPGSTAGLYVEPHLNQLRGAVASGGLTTASTAYTAGDQVGTQFTIANAARSSGGTGTIVGVSLLDVTDIIGGYNVWVYRASVTPASDNAAFSVSDGDQANLIGVIPLAGPYDGGPNKFVQAFGIGFPYDCSGGTSLYALLQCTIGHTFFAATTDLTLTFWLARD